MLKRSAIAFGRVNCSLLVTLLISLLQQGCFPCQVPEHDQNAVEVNADGDSEFMRAVVIVSEETQKGTARSRQEYVNPLLVLSGRDYGSISFSELQVRICDALRGKGLQLLHSHSRPAMKSLGLSRSSYYRHVRGMKDYLVRGCWVSM